MNQWIPDRKIWAGGFVGVVAFFIMKITGLPIEDATMYASLAGLGMQYFIPASKMDIVRKIDADVKKTVADGYQNSRN